MLIDLYGGWGLHPFETMPAQGTDSQNIVTSDKQTYGNGVKDIASLVSPAPFWYISVEKMRAVVLGIQLC